MAHPLFATPKQVKRFTQLNGNISDDRFLQNLFIAQEIHIQRFLGTDLYKAIENKIEDKTLAGHYLILRDDYINQALYHWAMVEILPALAITVSNKGVYRHTSENSQVATKEEVDYLVEKERQTAQYFSNRLIDYLADNATQHFPEYYTNNGNEDINPDDTAQFHGLVL